MNYLVKTVILLLSTAVIAHAAECDEFISLVKPAKDAYIKAHRIYPIPAPVKATVDSDSASQSAII